MSTKLRHLIRAVAVTAVLLGGLVLLPVAPPVDAAGELVAEYTMRSYPGTNTWTAGETRTLKLNVKNNGTHRWFRDGDDKTRLSVHFGSDSDTPHDGWASDLRVSLPNNVNPGESADITFDLTAPMEARTYVLRFRLVKEGSAWFDQILKRPNTVVQGLTRSYSYVSRTPVPPTTKGLLDPWIVGESRSYNIKIKNSGQEPWNAGGDNPVRLAVHFGGASDIAHNGWATDQRFDLPNDVAPGAEVTVPNVRIDPPSDPGSYKLRFRMLKEGSAWFDQDGGSKWDVQVQTVSRSYNVIGFAASGKPITDSWLPNETRNFNIRVENIGNEVWQAGGDNPVRLAISFGSDSDSPHEGWSSDQRFDIPGGDVPAGTDRLFTGVAITAPPATGSYTVRFRMVKEGAGWFDQNTSGLNKRTGIQVQGSNRAYQLAAPVGGMPATWQSGETRNLSVQINNTGQEAWNAGGEHNVRLGVSFGRNSDVPHADWATDQRFYLISDVPASGSQTLPTVAVTAPTDPGQYTLRFRMVKEGVEWFDLDTTSGFAKFPVTVGAPAGTPELRYRLAAPMSALAPTSWNPGQTISLTVPVFNNGTETWQRGGDNRVRVGVQFGSDSDVAHDGWASDQRADIPSVPGDIVIPEYLAPSMPGNAPMVGIPISVTAPTTPGTYWLRFRMVKEGSAWFEQNPDAKMLVTVAGPLLAASYQLNNAPSIWIAGETRSVSVTVNNTGAGSWNAGNPNPVRLGIHFGTDSDIPHDGWASDQRYNLSADVAPGGPTTFSVNVTAPPAPGTYKLRFRMLKEGVQWFDQLLAAPVTVSP